MANCPGCSEEVPYLSFFLRGRISDEIDPSPAISCAHCNAKLAVRWRLFQIGLALFALFVWHRGFFGELPGVIRLAVLLSICCCLHYAWWRSLAKLDLAQPGDPDFKTRSLAREQSNIQIQTGGFAARPTAWVQGMWRDGRVIAGERSSDVERFTASADEVVAILRRLPSQTEDGEENEDAPPAIGWGDVLEVYRDREGKYHARNVQAKQERIVSLEEAEQAFRKVIGGSNHRY